MSDKSVRQLERELKAARVEENKTNRVEKNRDLPLVVSTRILQ